jgi:hypothetical protein
MYSRIFLLILVFACQVCLAIEKELTPEVALDACDYAKLSKYIYSHKTYDDKKNITVANNWTRFNLSRAAIKDNIPDNFKTANSTAPIAVDPIGFHAEAYENSEGKIAIVFEGTHLLSAKDWDANISHLKKLPKQYEAARIFTGDIIDGYCPISEEARLECLKKITVTGHSLGGGLAQYVALKFGLKAYIFNPAGLWAETITDASNNREALSRSFIRSFISQGYHFGWEYGTKDIVQMTGIQFALEEYTVPINLPLYAWDSATMYSNIHKMENMEEKICEISQLSTNPMLSIIEYKTRNQEPSESLKLGRCHISKTLQPKYVNNPSCTQIGHYQIYLDNVTLFFLASNKLLSNRIKKTDQVRDWAIFE